MILTCPHCGFSKDIDAARFPLGTARVTCPRCRQSFSLSGHQGESAEAASLPAASHILDAQAAPSAASLPKAGFWIRFVAFLVDSLLVSAGQAALGFALSATIGLIGSLPGEEGAIAIAVVGWLAGSILGVLYWVLFTGYCGQTPGKMAVRVKVIRTDGSPITYGRAFLRETLGKFLSGIILGVGYFMIAFDAQKQGLHDKIADTYVIKL
jgi:predicted Zn finger-like uncharacterized protein